LYYFTFILFQGFARKYSVYKTEINGRGNPLRWPRDTLYPQKLALTSPTSGGRPVGIVRLRTKAPRSFLHVNELISSYINHIPKEVSTDNQTNFTATQGNKIQCTIIKVISMYATWRCRISQCTFKAEVPVTPDVAHCNHTAGIIVLANRLPASEPVSVIIWETVPHMNTKQSGELYVIMSPYQVMETLSRGWYASPTLLYTM
jgi:hypothetical protein